MSYMLYTVDAGPEHMQTIYPVCKALDSRAVKTGKRQLSKEAKDRANLSAAYKKLEMELAANYRRGDLWITLTFDDEHLPQTRAQVQTRVKRFTQRLRRVREGRHMDLVYHYAIEHKHLSKDEVMNGRWHIHMVLNSTGKDYKMLQQLWGQGRVDIDRLQVNKDRNFETLARYMCKEPRDKLGLRLWSSSRNCAKPEKDRQRVDDDYKLTIPRGAMVLSDTGYVTTVYGRYRFVRYILPREIRTAPGGRR